MIIFSLRMESLKGRLSLCKLSTRLSMEIKKFFLPPGEEAVSSILLRNTFTISAMNKFPPGNPENSESFLNLLTCSWYNVSRKTMSVFFWMLLSLSLYNVTSQYTWKHEITSTLTIINNCAVRSFFMCETKIAD